MPSSWPTRARSLPPVVADALLAAALIAVDVVSLLWPDSRCGCATALPTILLLTVAQAAPLALRRVAPASCWLLVGLTAIAWELLDHPITVGEQFALIIALYSVAAHASRRIVIGVAALTAIGVVGTIVVVAGWRHALVESAVTLTVYAAPMFLGDGVRSRRSALRALEQRATRLEREREALARLAVIEERGRIARDLHDVVAHHLSVMVIQSEAAAAVVEGRPDLALGRLESLSATGRKALVEMRRVLGVLRQPDHTDRAPQPGLDGVAALVSDARQAGLDCRLHQQGHAVEVAHSTGLSAYRIVQESLTNVRRHAGPAARVDVTLVWDDSDLTVTIRDDGPLVVAEGAAGPDETDGPGLGLVGMHERAATAGGTLHHGPLPHGGYEVIARLPLHDRDGALDTAAAGAGEVMT